MSALTGVKRRPVPFDLASLLAGRCLPCFALALQPRFRLLCGKQPVRRLSDSTHPEAPLSTPRTEQLLNSFVYIGENWGDGSVSRRHVREVHSPEIEALSEPKALIQLVGA